MTKIDSANRETLLQQIDSFLLEHPLPLKEKDLIFAQCFNEVWFSNMLAWLMNPKGTHNLGGVKFAKKFLEMVAQLRTKNALKYARKMTLLKFGKEGKGVSSKRFSLKNAAVIREFYLAKAIGNSDMKGPRYCDVVLLDLDTSDGLMLVIENKLFSTNYPNQLETYYDLVET